MKRIIEYLKKISSFVLAIVIITLLILPYIFIIIYLKKNNRTIELYPEFKIKEIKGNEEVNRDLLKNSITHAEDILKRIRG